MSTVAPSPASEDAAAPSFYKSSMRLFDETAKAIRLDERIRMELAEPHYELIFHITVDINNRLVPFTAEEMGRRGDDFDDLPDSRLDPEFYTVLANGQVSYRPRVFATSNASVRDGVIRAFGRLYRIQPRMPMELKCYRVQHNNIRGPYKGGIRYHHEVTLDLFKVLAAEMTWKTAISNIPLGGGKDGIRIDPREFSADELERISSRFMYKLKPFVGPYTDIPAPDVGTTPTNMGHFFRQYSDGEREPATLRGCVTGKDVRIWGSEGRDMATGRGLYFCIEEWLRHQQTPKGEKLIPADQVSFADLSFTLQGYGNVGSAFARIAVPRGATLVAVNDRDGTIYNPNGIDPEDLFDYVYRPENLKKSVAGYPKAEQISRDEFWGVNAFMFVPAGLGGVVTEEVASKLNVKLVAEGANAPCTNEGEAVLQARGIDIIPDIIANAGGVIVSYYEWIQNNRVEHWSEEEVNQRLSRLIKGNYNIILDIAANRPRKTREWDSRRLTIGKPVQIRMAAMALALQRLRGHYEVEGFSH
jgi:glutamate dehydrogenase (NAD(P)+)